MKPDDPILNIQFVKEIKKHECLYNFSGSGGPIKRNAQDKIWQKMSRKFNEPASVLRERWRNIRTAFYASEKNLLTNDGIRPKRSYYLSKYLQFLLDAKNHYNDNQSIITQFENIESNQNTTFEYDIPADNDEMIKEDITRNEDIMINGSYLTESGVINEPIINETIQNNCTTTINEHLIQTLLPIDDDINNKVDESYQSCSSYTKKNYEHQKQSRKRKRKIIQCDDVDMAIIDLAKNLKRNNNDNNNDTNGLFLQSILPDMKKLTDQQNRSFRIKVLTILNEFLLKNE